MKHLLAVLLLCGGLALPGVAQAPEEFDFYARGPYQAGIPRPEQILGYPIGTRHSYHYQMEGYIQALAQATPHVAVVTYGESYEGRKLYLVLVSSEENIVRLEEIRAATARLADPRQVASAAELQRLIAATPATVWLNFANDGNESAAFEAAMQVAYQLAAGEDETTRMIRARVLTIVDPASNPESHDRFVAWYNAIVHGPRGNPDPNAAEHTGDWLMNSNDNHYHIDLNRDAIVLSQRETRAIVRQIHRWNPQVFIDHHGNPPIFFFPPTAKPMNPNFPPSVRRWEEAFGRVMAAAFARHGWSFMNREVFDFFYPGYLDTYPSLNGAIGMTFETDGGGSQGLQLERRDGTRSTLAGAIAKHFTASLATVARAAEGKDQLLEDFYAFRKSGTEEGERGPVKQYVLLAGKTPARAAELVKLLQAHRIEIYRATAPFTSNRAHNYFNDQVSRQQFPAGSYVIPTNQPQKRLLTALLEPEAKLEEDFLAEVRARKERNARLGRGAERERSGFYDMTAWSLPLGFGVEAYWTEDRATTRERLAAPPPLPKGIVGGRARYAYLFKPDSNASLKLMAQLFRKDFKLAVARTEFAIGENTFPPGTILLRVERNPEKLHERIRALAEEIGVRVWAVDSAWTDRGITLGSRRITDLKAPRVAAAIYRPTSGRSYGHLWFLFEQILDYPFTPIRVERFRTIDLSNYDVIIFPPGSDAAYQGLLGTRGIARLKAWIEGGGVFVGLQGGAALATRKGVAWTSSRLVGRPRRAGQAAPEGEAQAARPVPEREEPVLRTPGAMLRVELNPAHFLSFGSEPEQVVLHNSNLIFTPTKGGTNVATYAKENPRVSGFVWEETLERLAGSAYLIDENRGRGHVILFADDPNYRLLWPRLTRLFVNSVFLAASLR
ncbi:MAG: M14 family zinc carboxypeptidase [Terriglobia bacterium]